MSPNSLENQLLAKLGALWREHRSAVMAVVAALVLLIVAMRAFAGTVTLGWTPPTQNTDGTPLIVAKYHLYRAPSAAGLATAVPIPVLAPATGYVDTSAPSGTTQFYSVTALNAAGAESAQSNSVSAVVPAAKPMPPAALTVGAITAFDIVKQPGKLILLAVGTVPNGTACDTTQSVNGLYAVPTAAITWFGNVRPPVAFAACG